jgi:hypothetical protein
MSTVSAPAYGALPNLVIAHRAGAQHTLLGGLDQQHQCPGPFVFVRRHVPRRTNQARNVHIVPTGVHDEYFVARDRIYLLCARLVLEPGLFFYRKPVHIGSHHDQRTVTILEHCDNTSATHALGYVEARQTELHGHPPRRFCLNCRQLRIAVKMIEQRCKVLVVVTLDAVAELGGEYG